MPLEPRHPPAVRLEVGRYYRVRASVDGLQVEFVAALAAVGVRTALGRHPVRLWCGSDSDVEVEEVPL